MQGIYQIRNKVNNKIYIGSSVDILRRWKEHKRRLRGDYHSNLHFQRSWNKHGENNFKFEILMLSDELLLKSCEQYFLDNLEPEYNISTKASGGDYWSGKSKEDQPFYGKHHTEKTKQKMSEVKYGENNPFYGKHHSEETKRKMSKAQLIEKNHMYGKHHTEKTKQKISKALSGKNNPSSKFTEKDVLEIRERYTGEKGQQVVLAKEYGVVRSTICSIVNRKTWKHV